MGSDGSGAIGFILCEVIYLRKAKCIGLREEHVVCNLLREQFTHYLVVPHVS